MQTGRRQERIIKIVAQGVDICSPSVSVVVPTYYPARTLGDCLEPIKNQDYQGENEVVTRDGGSSDSTLEIANFEENEMRT